ncbi:hypothetical protein Bbelb_120100 [Branchiostoma belcheri]|nr:hypothetical protein Bbelb_120100 [Branchiostoma belcheri]
MGQYDPCLPSRSVNCTCEARQRSDSPPPLPSNYPRPQPDRPFPPNATGDEREPDRHDGNADVADLRTAARYPFGAESVSGRQPGLKYRASLTTLGRRQQKAKRNTGSQRIQGNQLEIDLGSAEDVIHKLYLLWPNPLSRLPPDGSRPSRCRFFDPPAETDGRADLPAVPGMAAAARVTGGSMAAATRVTQDGSQLRVGV